jgi:hypothetical protein
MIYLLEEPVDGDTADTQRSNIVENGRCDIDAVRATAGTQVDDLRGRLLAIALDSDPSFRS